MQESILQSLSWSETDLNGSLWFHRSIYKSSPMVTNICIHADSNANKPMAVRYLPLPSHSVAVNSIKSSRKIQIIVPNEQAVRKLASEQSLIDSADSAEWKEVCQSSEVSKAVLAEMNGVGKKAGLKPLEVTFFFLSLPFTVWY